MTTPRDDDHNDTVVHLTAEQARIGYEKACALLQGEGHLTSQTVRCWICKHSIHAHYKAADGTAGCVATSAAPMTLTGALDGELPGAAHVAGAAGCLCPGYIQGALPHAMTKHLDGLDAHEEELCPDPACEHDLLRHGGTEDFTGEPYGCWACPCAINELPATSLFSIALDTSAVDEFNTAVSAAAHGTNISLGSGWMAGLEAAEQNALTLRIWQPDGLHFRSQPIPSAPTQVSIWETLSRHETVQIPMTITECWWHTNECDRNHHYKIRLMP